MSHISGREKIRLFGYENLQKKLKIKYGLSPSGEMLGILLVKIIQGGFLCCIEKILTNYSDYHIMQLYLIQIHKE